MKGQRETFGGWASNGGLCDFTHPPPPHPSSQIFPRHIMEFLTASGASSQV